MTSSTRAFGLLASCCAVIALAACDVSQDEESRIGKSAAQQVDSTLPILHDPQVVDYVNDLGRSIARTTSRADLDWQFAIVNTDVVNAFALPGGFIYVNRGVIEHAANESEVASVLGHEIEHVVRRHSVQKMEKAQGANAVVGIACHLTNICQSTLGQVAIQVGGSAVFARFGRQAEAQADSGGFGNEMRAGLDPGGMLTFFERLVAEEHRQPRVLAWFADHPGTQDRIAMVSRMLASVPPGERRRLRTDSPEFEAMKRHLAGLPAAPADTVK